MDIGLKEVDIDALRNGDKRAYEKIYNEFFDVLYHLCLHYLNDEKVSEEIVQDTFMKLWEIKESLNDEVNIRNFLYTITKNNCLNYIRNQKVVLKYQANVKYLEMQFNYEAIEKLGDYVQFEQLREKIDEAIANLPEGIRETFILNRFEDMPYKEIAWKLQISVKTVEARVSKALRILRVDLKDYLCILCVITSLFS